MEPAARTPWVGPVVSRCMAEIKGDDTIDINAQSTAN
jgi:hypothetical protein